MQAFSFTEVLLIKTAFFAGLFAAHKAQILNGPHIQTCIIFPGRQCILEKFACLTKIKFPFPFHYKVTTYRPAVFFLWDICISQEIRHIYVITLFARAEFFENCITVLSWRDCFKCVVNSRCAVYFILW